MTSFFSPAGGPIRIKCLRLVQNDMSKLSTALMWSKSKPGLEFQYGGQRTFGRIQRLVIPEPFATLQGAAS